MIELRWLDRTSYATDDQGSTHGSSKERILQYREWPAGTIPGLVEPNWADVPVVTAA